MNEGVKIELKGPDLQRILKQLSAASRDLTRPMRDVGEYLLRETLERFRNERDPEGAKWAALSSATIRAKGHARILHQTGRLVRSILYRPYRMGVEIGTNLEYAAVHQFGGTIKREASQTTVRHRVDAKGALLRQGPEGRLRNLAIFAKETHKRVVERVFSVPAHEVEMPARPFLGINGADRGEIAGILAEWFERKFRR